jgi:hypothetical protein
MLLYTQKKANWKIAIAVAICILSVLALSSGFVIAHAEHDCIGEDCAVCVQILVCEAVASSLGLALAAFAPTGAHPVRRTFFCSVFRYRLFVIHSSLLACKTRLNR